MCGSWPGRHRVHNTKEAADGSVDKPGLSSTVVRMKFVCQLIENGGVWIGEYAGSDIGPVRVTAPSHADAVRKLEGEIRYRLELCPCTGETYRDIEIEVVPSVQPRVGASRSSQA